MASSNSSHYQQWKAYSQRLRKDPTLLAYYTFESPGQTNAILPNLSTAGSVFDGDVITGEWVGGRLPGKAAMYFPADGQVVLRGGERFPSDGPFSVAVWFKAERLCLTWDVLISKGADGWRLERSGPDLCTFETGSDPDHAKIENTLGGKTHVADGRWHLAVVVYEPMGPIARKRLYMDGRLDVGG